MSELSDREIVTICAKLCGLKYARHKTSHPDSPLMYWGAAGTNRDGKTVSFNPLTDANDERLVLEAVRKKGQEFACYFENSLMHQITKITAADPARVFSNWILNHSKVGDISRAAAQAYKEMKNAEKS